MTSEAHNTDSLLRELGGCGIFQIILSTCVSLTYVSNAFTTIFMSFGGYNPGWRCLDDVTNNNTSNDFTNINISSGDGWWKYPKVQHNNGTSSNDFISDFSQSCQGFADCNRVQFNPESSTIVTEWGLICDQSWKVSLIISIQMAGGTLGYCLSGYLGDAYGRKLVLYINVLIHSTFTFVSAASVSWEMFVVCRFFLGLSCGMITSSSRVYMLEFVTPKWRAISQSLPLWCSGCILLSLCAIIFKDWRYVHVCNGVLSTVCLFPALFIPESLRWLVINNKKRKAKLAVEQIAKMNKVSTPPEDSLNQFIHQREKKNTKTDMKRNKFFSVLFRIFRGNYLKYALIIGFVIFTSDLVYFATSFGISAIPGDAYVNNIIVYSTELPANFIAFFAPNILGRKPTVIILNLVQSLSLMVYAVFFFISGGEVKEMGMLLSVIVTRICCDMGYFMAIICTSELFPTVTRLAAVGYMMFISGIAGTLSPYLVISGDISTVFVMAGLSLLCCPLFVFIPETLGTDLRDSDDVVDVVETESGQSADGVNVIEEKSKLNSYQA